jgi:hypothetical protein
MVPAPLFAFCENNVSGFLVQPSSVVSAIPLIVIGLFIWNWERGKDNPKGVLFGLITFYLGLTTFLMHGFDTPLFRFLDGSSMILFLSYVTFLKIESRKITKNMKVSLFLLYNLIANLLLFYIPIYALIAFAINLALFSMMVVSEKSENKRQLITSFAFFILAFLFWFLDSSKILCNPENHVLTGHAAWHILSAFGILFLYRYLFPTK